MKWRTWRAKASIRIPRSTITGDFHRSPGANRYSAPTNVRIHPNDRVAGARKLRGTCLWSRCSLDVHIADISDRVWLARGSRLRRMSSSRQTPTSANHKLVCEGVASPSSVRLKTLSNRKLFSKWFELGRRSPAMSSNCQSVPRVRLTATRANPICLGFVGSLGAQDCFGFLTPYACLGTSSRRSAPRQSRTVGSKTEPRDKITNATTARSAVQGIFR